MPQEHPSEEDSHTHTKTEYLGFLKKFALVSSFSPFLGFHAANERFVLLHSLVV